MKESDNKRYLRLNPLGGGMQPFYTKYDKFTLDKNGNDLYVDDKIKTDNKIETIKYILTGGMIETIECNKYFGKDVVLLNK